jgi:hypothetical protein
MSGSNVTNDPGVYQSNCVFDTINMPRSRFEHRSSVTDNCGRFWLFGGAIFNPGGFLNDLWVFDPVQVKWNWVSGTNVVDQMGSYGTLGVSSPANMPSSRIGADAWWGNDNRFYMFGGSRIPWFSYLSDLWVFTPDSNCSGYCMPQMPVSLFTAPNHICPGTCTDFTNLSSSATSYLWTFSGANPSSSTDINPVNICYSTPGTYDVTLITTNANGSDTLTLSNYIIVYPTPPPQGITQSGDTLFAIAGATSYQWYFNGNIISGATDYFYVAQASGDYNVVATDANGCEVEAAIFSVLASAQFAVGNWQLAIFPNPVTDKLIIHNAQFTPDSYRDGTAAKISVYNIFGEFVLADCLPTAYCLLPTDLDVSQLPPGIYYIQISTNEKTYRSKFVKQ